MLVRTMTVPATYLLYVRFSFSSFKKSCEAVAVYHRHLKVKSSQTPPLGVQNAAKCAKKADRRVGQIHDEVTYAITWLFGGMYACRWTGLSSSASPQSLLSHPQLSVAGGFPRVWRECFMVYILERSRDKGVSIFTEYPEVSGDL